MQTLWIRLNSLDDIRKLLDITNRQEFICYLEDDTAKVNVRRPMEVFSLDFSKDLRLYINGGSDDSEKRLKNLICRETHCVSDREE